MRRITFENTRGEKIIFYLSPFSIDSLTGISEVNTEIQSQQAPYQDGDTYIDTILQPRYIELEGTIIETDGINIRERRSELSRVCNPKLGLGLITLEMDGDVKQIYGTLDGGVVFPERGEEIFQPFFISWKCPNPYWMAIEKVEQLVTFSGGLTFPLRLPTIFGNQDSKAKSRIIVNEGDAPTPIEITFEGPATSPIRIDNETTGEFIEVAQSLLAGEQLWISTAFGRKRVEKILVDGTRINAFHHIYVDPTGANPSSTFFQLQPGNNLMTYNTGVEYEKAPVTIRFQPRYLAI